MSTGTWPGAQYAYEFARLSMLGNYIPSVTYKHKKSKFLQGGRSFTVDGSTHFYYPVAIAVHPTNLTRSPLEYEIHRNYYDKAPDSLRPGRR